MRQNVMSRTKNPSRATKGESALNDPPSPAVARPSRTAILDGLTRVFAEEIRTKGKLRVVHRRANPRSSTYLADIVRVQFADGSTEHLLCKYAHGVELPRFSPHRGVAYEAAVYEQLSLQSPAAIPRYWGSFIDQDTGDFALVMRFYPHGMSAAQALDHGGPTALIHWMAAFHNWGQSHVAAPAWGFLTRYDADYYLHWLDVTCDLARPLASEYPWLDQAAAAYRERIPLLASRGATIIHGELTARNSLWADGHIMPIDWETAAAGPAEVDLAVFTFDWDLDDVRALEKSYVQMRWQGSPPADFGETMLAARLYVCFHWIFSNPDSRDVVRVRNHLETVQCEAARWGIIPTRYLIP
jgi:hypothetical protein